MIPTCRVQAHRTNPPGQPAKVTRLKQRHNRQTRSTTIALDILNGLVKLLGMASSPLPRSVRKRDVVLEAARSVFLRDGFAAASMDEITRTAGVSKPTVYAHFKSKRELLKAVVEQESISSLSPLRFEPTSSVSTDLRMAGRQLAMVVSAPELAQWDRLVSGEAVRQPEIGQISYDCGPGRILSGLRESIEFHQSKGRLRKADAGLMAEFLFGLLLGVPLRKSQLCGPVDRSEVLRRVDPAVDVFLAGYGVSSPERKGRA